MLLHPRNVPLAVALALATVPSAVVRSGEHGGCHGCADPSSCASCSPACKATWDEVRTQKPAYSITCEHACARDYDCWCAGKAACRCSPPSGRLIDKKRLYKADGAEKIEKVPKYEVTMAPAESCDCARCQGVCFWNPLSVLHYLLHH